nr:hypothetical protein [Mycobacterium uberis]
MRSGARPPLFTERFPPLSTTITPVAAVSLFSSGLFGELSGPRVIAVARPLIGFHVATAAVLAPPPLMIVNTRGTLGIPNYRAVAYSAAEQKMAVASPDCSISWNLLTGIGPVEPGHAGGSAVDACGTALHQIYGPAPNGTLPDNEIIIPSGVGNHITYARTIGPMQFLSDT